MAARQFAAHGEYNCSIQGRVLRVWTKGPWNRELIENFGAHINPLLTALSGSPWGVLAIVVTEAMHTPESFEAMVEGVRRQRANGRCATAVVLRDVFGEPIVRSMLERMYRCAGEPAAFFHDEAEATDWLEARLREKNAPG